jgi:protease PrsW
VTSQPYPSPFPGMNAGSAPAPPKRVDWRRIVVMGVVVALCLGCGIALLSIIGYNIGPLALVIGFVAALIPVPLLVAAFMWLDRYEPEPPFYLAFCFLWGAFVATLVAYLGNTFVSDLFERNHVSDNYVAVFVAPFIEESMKALGPILLLIFTVWRKRPAFNGIIDAIVFFGLSATGFAFSENILYLGGHGYAAGADQGGVAGGVQYVIMVFIGRIPLSGFAHPLFTSMTALGVGIALRTTNRLLKVVAPIGGWLLAMTLHGSWNGMAVLAQMTGHWQWLLYGYFAVMMPIFFAMVAFAMSLRSAEGRLTQRVLQDYVRLGWLSPPEAASLATMGRRRSARAWAQRVAGDVGSAGMRGFQLSATRLALLRDRMDRRQVAGYAPVPAERTEEANLLNLMSAYRTTYVGRDPLAPNAFWNGGGYHIQFPDGAIRSVPAGAEPVVPVPVVRAPYPAPIPYGGPGYGGPGYGGPGYGGPGYGGPGYGGPGAAGPGSSAPPHAGYAGAPYPPYR